ncbi:MAG: hypothetical protein ACT4OY_05145 [Alphaproteobacteria bacterium]
MSSPIVPAQPPLPGLTPQAEAPAEGDAKIVKLPQTLLEVRQSLQLEGRVVQSGPDGRITIRTDRGDIDIQIPRGQTPPAEGDRVEIEIPPGRPPQSAEVRQSHARETTAPPPRPAETPVSVEVREPQTRPAPAQQPHDSAVSVKTLPAQELVQLKPVTPENILPPPLDDMITQTMTAITAPAELKAPLIAVSVIHQQTVQLMETAPQKPAAISIYEPVTIMAKAPTPQTSFVYDPVAIIRQTSFPLISIPDAPKLALELKQSIQIAAPQKNTVSSARPTHLPDINLLKHGFETIPLAKPEDIFSIKPLEIVAQKVSEIIRAQVSVIAAALRPSFTAPQTGFASSVSAPAESFPPQPQLILQNMQAQALSATIVGQTPEKFPVVSMFMPALGQQKLFALQIPVENITLGTQLSITPQTPPGIQMPPGTLMASIAIPPPLPLSFITPEPWALMQQIEQAIAQIAPAAAQAMLNVTPSPANLSAFGPAALFFLAAVRGGDLSQWLGDRGVDALRRGGRGDLLSRLTQESGALNRLSAEPVSQDWRGISIPLAWQNEIHKMALFYKEDSSGDDNKNGRGKQTRFIFDLKLDQMGSVQLDGLFRTARLDLILRTQAPLSQTMQMTMRHSYTNALEVAGVSGEISFQNRPEQLVTINPDNKKLIGATA